MDAEGVDGIDQFELELLQLIAQERYNPDIFPQLITGLESQIKHNWFNSDINLAIIKLIQFYPETQDWNYEETILKILLKAMLNLPRPELQVRSFIFHGL